MQAYTYNPYSILGKSILITGASSGIGRATAVECSKLGAKLILNGRNEVRLKETFFMLDGQGHMIIPADLTNEDELKQLVDSLPLMDGIVCNAGISKTAPISFFKREDMEQVFDVNVFSIALLLKYILKKKRMKNPSSIVMTSSVGGVFNVSPGNGIYSMSKCALDAYMRTTALELSSKGIRCNSVNPGMTWTKLITDGSLTDEQLQEDMNRYPLKRYGDPKDIALAIIYLLSDASSWVTGTSLKIDGGFSLVR